MTTLINKIGIGSAQFGLNYGINNSQGIVNRDELNTILNIALKYDIKTIDTASAYGRSQEALGKYTWISGFDIITKLSPNVVNIEDELRQSLKILNVNNLYGCLFHSFDDFRRQPILFEKLREQKEKKIVKRIGFSIYYPSELEYLFDHEVNFDIIQIPYNIFDRRFEKLFPILKEKNIEIHVRSVFLQGLFFRPIQSLDAHFNSIKNKLIEFHNYCKLIKLSPEQLLLNFVLSSEYIDRVIIGVDSSINLIDNIEAVINFQSNINFQQLDLFRENDEAILLPFNWK